MKRPFGAVFHLARRAAKIFIGKPCNRLGRPHVWVTARFLGICPRQYMRGPPRGPRSATPKASTRR
ncbi:hypothetical protein DN387_00995 [Pseudomonas sp. FBF18]|nr:hypothetical protein [Pseudomonas sp. FBF18]